MNNAGTCLTVYSFLLHKSMTEIFLFKHIFNRNHTSYWNILAVAPLNLCVISPFGSSSLSYWILGTESQLWALLTGEGIHSNNVELKKKKKQPTVQLCLIDVWDLTFRSFSRIVWSLCCRSRFNDITSSFSWLMRMKLSVPPESIDWVMELLMCESKELEDGQVGHFILTYETILIVPVPIWWLHLQFWFLLWSLLLDWRRFMAARTIKWYRNSKWICINDA